MIRRAALAFGLLAIVLLAQSGTAHAQAKMSFKWNTFEQNGKTYSYPKWVADVSDVILAPAGASATIAVGPDLTAKSATMTVQKPGALPGSWTTLFTDANVTVSAKTQFNEHVLVGSDPSTPKTRIAPGTVVRFTWEVTFTSGAVLSFGPYEATAAVPN